jgi:hypothetical protein
MTLEQIFYLSQSVASVAVVGTLIYLGLQVRSAERSQRAIMQQGRADRASHGALGLADPELARVFGKATAGQNLTGDEFTQWMMMCRALFLSGEDSYLQHEAGQLDQPAFDSYVAGVRYYMSSPGIRAAWQVSRGQFGSDFRNFVDAILREPPLARGGDAYAEWHKLVESERTTPAA